MSERISTAWNPFGVEIGDVIMQNNKKYFCYPHGDHIFLFYNWEMTKLHGVIKGYESGPMMGVAPYWTPNLNSSKLKDFPEVINTAPKYKLKREFKQITKKNKNKPYRIVEGVITSLSEMEFSMGFTIENQEGIFYFINDSSISPLYWMMRELLLHHTKLKFSVDWIKPKRKYVFDINDIWKLMYQEMK